MGVIENSNATLYKTTWWSTPVMSSLSLRCHLEQKTTYSLVLGVSQLFWETPDMFELGYCFNESFWGDDLRDTIPVK